MNLCRQPGRLAAALLLLGLPVRAFGADVLESETPVVAPRPPPPPDGPDDMQDPCRGGQAGDEPALERMRGRVYQSVCASSRWLDGFFGDPRDYTEVYGQTYGRAGVGLDWNQRDDFGVNGFLRAKFPLPALGERFNAILGRDSEETLLDDTFDETTFLPGAFSDENIDSVWYAGISYGRNQGRNQRTDLSVGLKLSTPVNPYVRFRFRYYLHPTESVLLRLRITPFWENREGLGVTVAGDSDWSFRPGWMLRWANTATFSEETEGVRWRSRLALFQLLDPKSALRYELAIGGETDGIQPRLYGGKLSYRRSLWRDWFFLETSTALFWSREENPADDCDACVGFGFGFEIAFGDRYDRRLQDEREANAPATSAVAPAAGGPLR